MVGKDYVNKVGSTVATQGAKGKKHENDFPEGSGKTFSSEKRQFGGLRKAK